MSVSKIYGKRLRLGGGCAGLTEIGIIFGLIGVPVAVRGVKHGPMTILTAVKDLRFPIWRHPGQTQISYAENRPENI